MKRVDHIKTIGALLIAAAFLSGCATTTVDLSKFHSADLREAEIMPSKAQLKRDRIKIVVLDADEGRNAFAVNAQLGENFAKAVEKELSAIGTEVVDRNLAPKLKDELKNAEISGAGNYEGPQVAQYAIGGKLSSAEYDATYHEAQYLTDKDGKQHVSPAYYDHLAKVGGIIGLFELPSLRLVTTINITGSARQNIQTTGANWPTGVSLLRAALSTAISRQSSELKNILAPKGYVTERRTDGEKSIFMVLMGRDQGVKSGDKVVIYSLRNKTNALTGKEQAEELPVAEAKVSDQIGDTESWVVPSDKEAAMRVRLGDFVKVRYEQSLWDEWKTLVDSMPK